MHVDRDHGAKHLPLTRGNVAAHELYHGLQLLERELQELFDCLGVASGFDQSQGPEHVVCPNDFVHGNDDLSRIAEEPVPPFNGWLTVLWILLNRAPLLLYFVKEIR